MKLEIVIKLEDVSTCKDVFYSLDTDYFAPHHGTKMAVTLSKNNA